MAQKNSLGNDQKVIEGGTNRSGKCRRTRNKLVSCFCFGSIRSSQLLRCAETGGGSLLKTVGDDLSGHYINVSGLSCALESRNGVTEQYKETDPLEVRCYEDKTVPLHAAYPFVYDERLV